MRQSHFGVIGLGVMGRNIALNIADQGISLSTYNRAIGAEKELLRQFENLVEENHDISIYDDLPQFIASLERPRKMLIMIKAGSVVDDVLHTLIPLLDQGDIVIDGGNSHYKDTLRRQEQLKAQELHFIGSGISGGELGARRGPSIMPSGHLEAYQEVSAVLESIAAKDAQGQACCTYIGKGGSGHFVKMIHNGIEYAEMQLLAEVYDLLKPRLEHEAIIDFLKTCRDSQQGSYLLDITIDILAKKEDDGYLLDKILDRAGNKGTGSWGSKAAFDYGTANTMMASAVFCRYMSSYKDQRVQLSRYREENNYTIDIDLKSLEEAYAFARLINHHQGFDLIQTASEHYGWDINLSEVSRIWTNGCIIRSELMTTCIELFKTQNTMLDNGQIIQQLKQNLSSVKRILKHVIDLGISAPCFQTAYEYWVSMTRANLPANMIQAQRDYFGAHTYERTDQARGTFFHTAW